MSQVKINSHIKEFLITGIILLLLDGITLNILSNFFNKQIVKIQGGPIKMDIIAAIVCYLFLFIILYYFIISKNKSLREAFLLGFLVYGVYELTTKSLLKKWEWSTVFVDTTWGGVLFLLTTLITYKLRKYI
jgi:uncharacterized membrane protein